MNTNGNGLMSVDELDLKYLIANTCMFYNSFFGYLQRLWKRLIQNGARLLSLTGSKIEYLFKLEIISSCVKPQDQYILKINGKLFSIDVREYLLGN